jgi:hypothetical protein
MSLPVTQSWAVTPGSQLDNLLAARFFPECWADRVWSAGQLPACLRWRVDRLPADADWRAYQCRGHILFAVARSYPQTADAGGSASLDVAVLDGDGTLHSSAVWNYERHTGWKLGEVRA